MKYYNLSFSFEIYESSEELNKNDAELIQLARIATNNAYAPYSLFYVGAAARMSNGVIIQAGNQENASFPVGLCAERVLLSCVSAQYPGVPIDTIAVSYDNRNDETLSGKPISPCGICRQTLLEFEERQEQPIRIVLAGMEGEVFVLDKAALLLPLSFSGVDME